MTERPIDKLRDFYGSSDYLDCIDELDPDEYLEAMNDPSLDCPPGSGHNGLKDGTMCRDLVVENGRWVRRNKERT